MQSIQMGNEFIHPLVQQTVVSSPTSEERSSKKYKLLPSSVEPL